ncbi:hypothetical protein [Streptomyces sp. cmx-18-6]|uniref:hypothetical protein n=1 Tax=Streptomyces sp. cmx-18-6 TaxID=2790930 RepID=UPI003980BD4A
MTLAGVACAAVLLTTGTATAAGQTVPTAGTAASETRTASASTASSTAGTAVQNDVAASGVVAAAKCNLALGKPWKENIAKKGRSDHSRAKYRTVNSCAGYGLVATLQYHRWHGWSGLVGAHWTGNRSKDRILQWKCQGKGTFTYRVAGTVRGGLSGGGPEVRRGHGAERRFAC